MDIILCHTTADFDTLGAAVGCTHLLPGSRIVLAGGCHPAVRDYLALHRDEYPLIERRSVRLDRIRSLTIVDTQRRDRLGKTAEWLDREGLEIFLYDHHLDLACDLGAVSQAQVEAVGATTTLIAEALQRQNLTLNPMSATVMALGIHVDTGSLTFDHTTPRDALALAWLMQQGANVSVLAQYVDPGLSPALQTLLQTALAQLVRHEVQGFAIARVDLDTSTFVPGLSSLTSRLMDFAEADALLLVARYCRGEGCEPLMPDVSPNVLPNVLPHGLAENSSQSSAQNSSQPPSPNSVLTLIARSRIPDTDWNQIVQPWGGGGHPRAATVTLRGQGQAQALEAIWQAFLAQIPQPAIARELMSSPVRTIRPETTIQEAQRILLRYGHSGLSVVDHQDQLVGIISRRDLDLALHHGFGHAPVKGYMSNQLKTITPDTPLPEIEAQMVTFDVGRLPVLDQGKLVGIVTRTDVLRQLHQSWRSTQAHPDSSTQSGSEQPMQFSAAWLQQRLAAPLWQLLNEVAIAATAQQWQLYLVGGAVRDLLIAADATTATPPPSFEDIDLVVDGCHPGAEPAREDLTTAAPSSPSGAGVILAKQLQEQYPQARLQVHGRFQTAALLWHQDPIFGSLWVDIATSRTEFYPYPAANPEVEASSLQQDLYRRDFTINALALRLTTPHTGQLIDFFGGRRDLQAKQIRVLHANSFIEDPTRIYRAVRFAVKLGFEIEPQTEGYIRYAIASGIYDRIQADLPKAPSLQNRLKTELKYILQASFWRPALKKLNDLGALACIHPTLVLTPRLWKSLCRCDYWWQQLNTIPTPPETAWPPLWQLRLELLIAAIAPEHRASISDHLQLPDDCRLRLIRLESTVAELEATLPRCTRPSQVVQRLETESLPLLLVAAMQVGHLSRRQIYKYMMQWSQIAPPLDGHHLRQLGYQPGPQFKTMLQTLKFAYLDGKITSVEAAQRYLAQHFSGRNSGGNSGEDLSRNLIQTRPGHPSTSDHQANPRGTK